MTAADGTRERRCVKISLTVLPMGLFTFNEREASAAHAPDNAAGVLQSLMPVGKLNGMRVVNRLNGVARGAGLSCRQRRAKEDCGGCRKPFPTLTEAQKAYIERVVRENM